MDCLIYGSDSKHSYFPPHPFQFIPSAGFGTFMLLAGFSIGILEPGFPTLVGILVPGFPTLMSAPGFPTPQLPTPNPNLFKSWEDILGSERDGINVKNNS